MGSGQWAEKRGSGLGAGDWIHETVAPSAVQTVRIPVRKSFVCPQAGGVRDLGAARDTGETRRARRPRPVRVSNLPSPARARLRLAAKRVVSGRRPRQHLLFRAVSETLTQFGHKNLGGRLGFMLILHTWDQRLRAHFHLHGVIPGGALSEDRSRWIDLPCKQFLFPVRALGRVFRARFLQGVMRLLKQGKLRLSGKLARLANPATMRAFLRPLWNQDWVVYSKRPFGGPEKVLDYLGRYTHRVAISNHRLLSVGGGEVRFRYRDRRQGDVPKVAELPADEFIARFLQHVVPSGLMRIRHYGFLANRHKREALAACRRLLGAASPKEPPEKKDVRQWMLELAGIDIRRCPNCGHGSLLVEDLPVPEPHADPFVPIRAPP